MERLFIPLKYSDLELLLARCAAKPFCIRSLDGKFFLEMSKLQECLIKHDLEWLNGVLSRQGVELYICALYSL